MGKQGQRQFGSVRKLPSGRWQARYQLDDGRRLRAPRTFATKSDATLWLDQARTDLAAGLRADPERGRLTLESFAREWLRELAGISGRTREIYTHQIEEHILPRIDEDAPVLGAQRLNTLTPELIRRWYLALATNRTPSVAAKAYVRLRQILTQAVDDDRIVKNPCRIRRGGVEHHPEQRFATVPELLALSRNVPHRYKAMILTAGLGVLRQGELLALRRADLDLDDALVYVRRKRQVLDSGAVLENAPKTRAGRRAVSLPQPLVEELRTHLELYVGVESTAYVFTSSEGVPIERNNFRQRIWMPAVEASSMDGFHFHELRHTAGTLAARTGATTKELMARLGHASPQAAMIYQHAASDRDRNIAEGLTVMLREASQQALRGE
jgi:integrase